MNDMINVLNIRNTIIDGGAEKAILNWHAHIDRRRFDCRLACFANPRGVERRLVNLAVQGGMPTSLIPWGRRKRLVAAVREVVKLIKDHRIHLVHSHDAKCDVVVWMAARLTGIPVVGSAYAWFGRNSQFRVRFYEWLDVRLLNTFQAVIGVSKSLVQESISVGVRPELLTTVPTGIDYDQFQQRTDIPATRRRFGLGADEFTFVNLARLWPEKGHTYLLQAMKEVTRHHPTLRLVVVGEGPLADRLQSESRSLGLSGNIIWAGFPGNLPDLLNSVQAQVHASTYEGLPLAILSGMAAGLPLVATDVGGVSEVVFDRRNGLLVPAKDPAMLAAAILSVVSNYAFAKKMGENGRQLIFERYRMQNVVRCLEDVYQRVYDACYRTKRQEMQV
jgi:glycosyltransferase involved in cell wall biosynthesis